MKGLIISANPLFTEVISQALMHYFSDGYLQLTPEKAAEGLENFSPELILVDDRTPSELFTQILEKTRQLKKNHVILINPESNDCIVVRSYLTTITNLEVFMNKIVSETKQDLVDPVKNGFFQQWEDANSRAEMYHFLASILNQRPDADFVHNLRIVSKTAFEKIQKESTQPELTEGISQMVNFITETSDQPIPEVEQALAVDWTRLFRGVLAGYGPPPPYESIYRMGNNDPSRFLQNLVHEYARSGAKAEVGTNNRPDYLGMELAFLSFLSSRESEAWKVGDIEEANKYADVEREFVRQHPAKWLETFCKDALLEARTDFYSGFLLVLRSVFQE